LAVFARVLLAQSSRAVERSKVLLDASAQPEKRQDCEDDHDDADDVDDVIHARTLRGG
jgi:hypothetical protein